MNHFTYYTPTKVVFGSETELQTGKLVKECGGTRVLIHAGTYRETVKPARGGESPEKRPSSHLSAGTLRSAANARARRSSAGVSRKAALSCCGGRR